MKLERVIAVRNNKTVYRDGELAIKVFNIGYSKGDILNEALNQALIEEAGIRVPKVQAVQKIDGKWAIVSDFIQGKTLAQLIEKTPQRQGEYMDLFVTLQNQVHTQTMPLLNRLAEKMHRQISQAELEATVRYDLHARLDAMSKRTSVCHGDFNPSNIIITEAGDPYILDWSHASQGNAGADIARTYLLFWLAGDRAGADDYLQRMAEKSALEAPYIVQWLPIVAASLSVTAKGEEKKGLLRWANLAEGQSLE